ncbi:hypothetical protein SAMN06265173_1483 [Thalassovita litoralis]|uniref:Uncharacterized protein n=1 Tax=Thalassovita litoralis TaxID=1010611 RepID=A0A521FS44_9RHOB|nr:hypothetical protein [Thalassovita litoralis]SMO98936.1 hypothetical protein SAMN06265173_1483 [Thalassovita litoralis]
MRDYSIAEGSYLADLGAVVVRLLVWIEARNRSTGLVEATGFWTGQDVRSFSIGGVSRTYYGAGGLLGIEPIRASVGLSVRMHKLSLSRVPAEVQNLIHGYDARLAPVEVHRALFHPATRALISEPHRILKGTVEEMPVPRAVENTEAAMSITVASAARSLTRALTVRKSDAAQRAVNSDDRGREYAATSGAVGVFWNQMENRGSPPPTAPATATLEDTKDKG